MVFGADEILSAFARDYKILALAVKNGSMAVVLLAFEASKGKIVISNLRGDL